MKRCFKIAILASAMMLSMLNMTACNGNSNDDSSYVTYFENVMPYQAQDLSDFISVSGTVASESSINVTSSVSAKITQLNVAVGDYVNEGDVLCVFDNTEIQQQIDELETNIKNASALDENSKELNRKALENAKEDQQIQLKSAKEAISDAKDDYNKVYTKYTETIDKINNCVLQYNDVCNEIAQYESTMSDIDYDNYMFSDEDFFEDDMNYDSYTEQDDTYSNLMFKREELSSKIESYKLECTTYEEQLEPLQKAINTANDNYDAVKRSTDQAIESAQNTVDMQDYQNDSSSSTATQLKNLKTQLSECTVKAEKSGTITSLGVAQGDTPTEGALLMTIENNSQLKITVNIDEKDILKVKEGMNVVITSEATGDTEIQGTVSKVITIISSNGNNNTSLDNASSSGSNGFTAEITISGDSDLLVGMKAKAKIMLVEKSGCYSVLYDCIMYDDDGNPYVLVADTSASDDGTTATVRRADITIGEESGSYVEISSDDLKENDLIITTPYDVIEGDTLEISPYALDFGDNMESSEDVPVVEVID